MKRQRLYKEFRIRWQKIKASEDIQIRKMSVRQKLRQLSSLVGIGLALGLNFSDDKDRQKARCRWLILKKAYNG